MAKPSSILFKGFDISLPPEGFPGSYVPTPMLNASRGYLGLLIMRQAHLTSERVGFGWVGHPEAPDTFDALSAAYDYAVETGESLPVSNLHCHPSVYSTASINVALRFWHDTHHVLRNRSFRTVDEIDMSLWHLDVAAGDGIVRGSVAWRLLEADTLGQTLCSAALGRFPVDQVVFDLNCLQFGIADALVMESECVTTPQPARAVLEDAGQSRAQ